MSDLIPADHIDYSKTTGDITVFSLKVTRLASGRYQLRGTGMVSVLFTAVLKETVDDLRTARRIAQDWIFAVFDKDLITVQECNALMDQTFALV